MIAKLVESLFYHLNQSTMMVESRWIDPKISSISTVNSTNHEF
jgi:hypothetical protein